MISQNVISYFRCQFITDFIISKGAIATGQGRGTIRAGGGTFRAAECTVREGQGF